MKRPLTLSQEFKTLAATGKLIRMILTSFFENVPEVQQSAITIWGLSDNSKEHEYWLKDESPNISDASYGRKVAYKGVCDAIAGEDVSAGFTSPNYHQTSGKWIWKRIYYIQCSEPYL